MTAPDWPGDTAPAPHQAPADRLAAQLASLAEDIAYVEGRPVTDVAADLARALETPLACRCGHTTPAQPERTVLGTYTGHATTLTFEPDPAPWPVGVGWWDSGAA